MPERSRGRAVAFVVDGPLDQPTGGYFYDSLVARGLATRGFVVDVVNLDTSSPLAVLRENARLLRLLSPDKPAHDIVIVDELCHPRAALAARLRPRGRFSPRLVTLLHHLSASERTGISAAARLVVERSLLLASDRVIVTSETTKRAATSAGVPEDRAIVVRPGRDRLGGRDKPPDRREEPVRLLFLGALTPRKDPLLLLDAFAAVAPHATLTLAGPADRDPLHAARVLAAASRHGDRVRVTGAVSDDDLVRLLDTHDVLVLPSRYEGFGMALAEAVSFGLAIVSTHAGAIPEVVRHGEEALLVAPGDARALAAALVAVATDPRRLARMQRAALDRASSLPTWTDTQEGFARAITDT
jgi:glycosyltransferase involved in cell wall biosynthesis